jgi:hypothetical protein
MGKPGTAEKKGAIYLVHRLPINIVCTTIGFVIVGTLLVSGTVAITEA